MLYSNKFKEICENLGIDTASLPDSLYGTYLTAICKQLGIDTKDKLYGKLLREICDSVGVDRAALPDGLISTLLTAIAENVSAGTPKELIVTIKDNILTIENYDKFPAGTMVVVNFTWFGTLMSSLSLQEKTHDLAQYISTWYNTTYEVTAYAATPNGEIYMNGTILWTCSPPVIAAPTLELMGPTGVEYLNIQDNSGQAFSYRLYAYNGDGERLGEQFGGVFVSQYGSLAPALDAINPTLNGYPFAIAIVATVITVEGVESLQSDPIYIYYSGGVITQ